MNIPLGLFNRFILFPCPFVVFAFHAIVNLHLNYYSFNQFSNKKNVFFENNQRTYLHAILPSKKKNNYREKLNKLSIETF